MDDLGDDLGDGPGDDLGDNLGGAPVTAKELVQMIVESGNNIPPNDINEFAGYVAELTGQKAPGTLKQKRAYIANWYAEQAPPSAAHTPRDAAPSPLPEAAFDKVEAPPDRETLLQDIAQYNAQVATRPRNCRVSLPVTPGCL